MSEQSTGGGDLRVELRLRMADEALSAAADSVQQLLREAALDLRPFPPFPGAFFTMGVEVEPDGVDDRQIGCVIVTEAGELRELQLSFDDEGPGGAAGGVGSCLDAGRNAGRAGVDLSARSVGAGAERAARGERAAAVVVGTRVRRLNAQTDLNCPNRRMKPCR